MISFPFSRDYMICNGREEAILYHLSDFWKYKSKSDLERNDTIGQGSLAGLTGAGAESCGSSLRSGASCILIQGISLGTTGKVGKNPMKPLG